MRLTLILNILVFIFSSHLCAQTSAQVSRSHLAEVDAAKGILEYQKGDFSEAAKWFNQSLSKDPGYLLAYEYEALLEENKKDGAQPIKAVKRLEQALEKAPERRKAMLHFHLGRLYLSTSDLENAEKHLKNALNGQAFLAHSHYLLGVVLFEQKRLEDSHDAFYSAYVAARSSEAREGERDLFQSIEYYLGAIEAVLGSRDFSLSRLNSVERGPSAELRRSAWQIHKNLNQSRFFAEASETLQKDSNILSTSLHHFMPIEQTGRRGVRSIFDGKLGWEMNPGELIRVLALGNLRLVKELSNSYREYDMFDFNGSLEARFWTRGTWELRASYSPRQRRMNSLQFTEFETSHQFEFTGSYFPYRAWEYEAGFFVYANDLVYGALNGRTVGGLFSAKLRKLSARVLPELRYRVFADQTVSENLRTLNHLVALDLSIEVLPRSVFLPGFEFGLADYVTSELKRTDYLFKYHLDWNQILSARWLVFLSAEFNWFRTIPRDIGGLDLRRSTLSGGVRVSL